MLKEKIDADIKAAMISKNIIKRELLKFIKSEYQRKDSPQNPLSDADIQKIMRGQIESLKITPSDTSVEEMAILESYLPQLMTEEIIRAEITLLVSEDNSNIGSIMKHFKDNYDGLYDGKIVSMVARELMSK